MQVHLMKLYGATKKKKKKKRDEHIVCSLCLRLPQQLNKSLQPHWRAKRERGREMKREAGEQRAPGPPPSCRTSHLAVRAGPAVERAGACTCPSPPPLPPSSQTPAPTRRKSYYQIQSRSARGAMAAAAAAALDCVYDADHESGKTAGGTDTARARFLNAQSFTPSVREAAALHQPVLTSPSFR